MSSSLRDFKISHSKSSLATASDDELHNEQDLRSQSKNVFPLDVFHPAIKPLLNDLVDKYKLPRAYVGATLLSTYSTAIGASYVASWNGSDLTPLTTWIGLVGMSSSGKTLAINKIMDPLVEIQNGYNDDYINKTSGASDDSIRNMHIQHIIIRDIMIPTLVRFTLPDNPKGMVKRVDELVEWINGLNPMSKKEGTDEQFWLSTWNGGDYEMIRTGKLSYMVKRPFVNILGGIQWDVMHKIFAKDRDSSGFAFRILFASARLEEDNFLEFMRDASVSSENKRVHQRSIDRLYKDNEVYREDLESPRKCVFTPEAADRWIEWRNQIAREINLTRDRDEKGKKAGVFGKISEYATRFAAILHLADKSLNDMYVKDFDSPYSFKLEERISVDVVNRAIKLAEYFYTSALEVYDEAVNNIVVKDPKVIRYAGMLMSGKSYRQIAMIEYDDGSDAKVKKVYREAKKMMEKYPKIFRAQAR